MRAALLLLSQTREKQHIGAWVIKEEEEEEKEKKKSRERLMHRRVRSTAKTPVFCCCFFACLCLLGISFPLLE